MTREGSGGTAQAQAQAQVGDEPAEGDALVGRLLELHSLSSEAGRLLNGRRGIATDFDEASQRFAVALRPRGASEPARTVNARAANLRVVAEAATAYVHFGRGCDGCGVYPIEGRCFRCADCNRVLKPSDFCNVNDKFYCEPCYKKLVSAAGGAGKEYTAAPAAGGRMGSRRSSLV